MEPITCFTCGGPVKLTHATHSRRGYRCGDCTSKYAPGRILSDLVEWADIEGIFPTNRGLERLMDILARARVAVSDQRYEP